MKTIHTISTTFVNNAKALWKNPNGRKGTILLGTELVSAIVTHKARSKGNRKVQKGAMLSTLISFAASQYYLHKADKEVTDAYFDELFKFDAENARMAEFYAKYEDSIDEVEKHFAERECLSADE